MLRCTFGCTFTPLLEVVHGQVTANPPTNNPDATAVLELGALSPALVRPARKGNENGSRQAGTHTHTHTHHLLSLMAEF